MIIPSIDLQNGCAVQLRQGKKLLLSDNRDPVDLAREFARYGPVAVVDLDAALGRGENRHLIRQICKVAPCRVGGGVRTVDDVRDWIRHGAEKVMVGTNATPEFLRQFPREWMIACLDARGDQVVVKGWTENTGHTVYDQAKTLEDYCGEFLFTQVQVEGTLGGADFNTARELKQLVDIPITVAGGIRSAEEIGELEALGCNSQIGRVLYEGKIDLAEVWPSLVTFNEHGLVPTIVQEVDTQQVLMVAFSSPESLRLALETGQGWYWSRSRQELWRKGATSGHTQELIEARWDCDRDAVLFRVRQIGPACHTGRRSCFESGPKPTLSVLEGVLASRKRSDDDSSYTKKLLNDASLLASKLREETEEVIEANERGHIVWECADVVYHLMVHMQASGVELADVERELRSRF